MILVPSMPFSHRGYPCALHNRCTQAQSDLLHDSDQNIVNCSIFQCRHCGKTITNKRHRKLDAGISSQTQSAFKVYCLCRIAGTERVSIASVLWHILRRSVCVQSRKIHAQLFYCQYNLLMQIHKAINPSIPRSLISFSSSDTGGVLPLNTSL